MHCVYLSTCVAYSFVCNSIYHIQVCVANMPYTLLVLLDCRPDNWNANGDVCKEAKQHYIIPLPRSFETEMFCHSTHTHTHTSNTIGVSVAVQITSGQGERERERVAAAHNIHSLVGVAARSVHSAIPKAKPPLQRAHRAYLQSTLDYKVPPPILHYRGCTVVDTVYRATDQWRKKDV